MTPKCPRCGEPARYTVALRVVKSPIGARQSGRIIGRKDDAAKTQWECAGGHRWTRYGGRPAAEARAVLVTGGLPYDLLLFEHILSEARKNGNILSVADAYDYARKIGVPTETVSKVLALVRSVDVLDLEADD
jgi:hypothetical protein